jgi:hypothetical protein
MAQPTSRGINETWGGISESKQAKKENNGKAQDVSCYLCKLCDMICKTIVGWFTAFYYKDALKGNIRALIDLTKGSKISESRRNRMSSFIGSKA